jgi:hypothetical protein
MAPALVDLPNELQQEFLSYCSTRSLKQLRLLNSTLGANAALVINHRAKKLHIYYCHYNLRLSPEALRDLHWRHVEDYLPRTTMPKLESLTILNYQFKQPEYSDVVLDFLRRHRHTIRSVNFVQTGLKHERIEFVLPFLRVLKDEMELEALQLRRLHLRRLHARESLVNTDGLIQGKEEIKYWLGITISVIERHECGSSPSLHSISIQTKKIKLRPHSTSA